MKKKNPLIIIGICTLILTLPTAAVYNASNTTKLTFSPSQITGPPPDTGETFTVNVTIQDVTDLFTYDITISWNSTVLNYVGNVTYFTEFFTGTFGQGLEIYSPGKIEGIASSYTSGSGTTGSGPLFQITFNVTGSRPCSTWIQISNTSILLNSNGDDIQYEVVKGYFTLPEGPPSTQPPTPWPWIIVAVVVVIFAVSVAYILTRRRRT